MSRLNLVFLVWALVPIVSSAQPLGDFSLRLAYDNARIGQVTLDGTTTVRYDYGTGGGLGGVTVGPTTSVDAVPESDLPTTTRLGSPYPNPFNKVLAVPFDLANPSAIRVSISDVLGRELVVLEDGFRAAGRHEVGWIGPGAAGVYLVTLRMNEQVLTRLVTRVR